MPERAKRKSSKENNIVRRKEDKDGIQVYNCEF